MLEEYEQVDGALKLRVEMLELAIRFELAENELLVSRIAQLRRDYEFLSTNPNHARDLLFVNILEKMNQATFEWAGKNRMALASLLAGFLEGKPENDKDEQQPIFDYDEWLAVKQQAYS